METKKSTNTQQAAFQDIRVGGDFKVGSFNQVINSTSEQKPDFFEINIDPYKWPEFISPEISPNPVEILLQHNLLVLGENLELDLSSIARNLAWQLREKLQEKNRQTSEITIKEWEHNSTSQIIDLEIQKAKETTIFLLTQITPENVNGNLYKIKNAAANNIPKHYVIVTTDIPFVGWKLLEQVRKGFWPELEINYKSEDLTIFFVEELLDANLQKRLPLALQKNIFKPDNPIVEDLLIETVAALLKTPNNIIQFVQLLCENQQISQKSEILNLIQVAQNDEKYIRQWYYHNLSQREQLLALGLLFFNGLYDDQFFAALEEVVEFAWQKRDQSLRALDYCDLDNLRSFFNFVETKDRGNKIEIRSPKQCRILYKLVWESHRRQILAALPIFVKLAKDSVTSFARELYGSLERCEQLQKTISEAISDISLLHNGAIAATSVEDILISLAADSHITVQAVAARAMASWRSDRLGIFVDQETQNLRDQALFTILKQWQQEKRIFSLAKARLQAINSDQSAEPSDYVRATIAITVGFAGLFDPPNQLAKELCDLLKQLSYDTNQLVREGFCNYTLPMIVPQHLLQIKDMLRSMTEYRELVPYISASLAIAYRPDLAENPVLITLNLWYEDYKQNRVINPNENQNNLWANLLAAIALTYGYIQYDRYSNGLTINDGFEYLQKLLKPERNSLARGYVLYAICLLVKQNFERIENQLENLLIEVKSLTSQERQQIVEFLTEVYLDQREKLKGGDRAIQVNNRTYRIWLNPNQRYRTSVENAMLRWLKDDNNALAQQIAAQTSVSFAIALDREEENQIRNIKKLQQNVSSNKTVEQVWESESALRNSYLSSLVSWLVTKILNKEQYQIAIKNILPEGLQQNLSNREVMSFVLNNWLKKTDKEVQNISKLLKPSLFLAENFWLFSLGILALLTFVGMATANIIGGMLSSSPPTTTSSPSPSVSRLPAQTPISQPSILSKEQAVTLVNSYLQAKERIFAPPFDTQLAASLTTGNFYQDIVKSGGRIDWLQQNNAYYKFGNRQATPLTNFSSSSSRNEAEIDVLITEEVYLYQNGFLKQDMSHSNKYRFNFRLENNQWKISEIPSKIN